MSTMKTPVHPGGNSIGLNRDGMIKSKHLPFFVGFINAYTRLMIRKHFSSLALQGEFNDRRLPLLLIGNHFSWWDGFFANLLNIRIFKRNIHVMMLEEQLSGRRFLNYAGAYSIKKGDRSAMESLKYTAELMQSGNNLIVMYPQGEFQSLYRGPVKFEKGIKIIADLSEGEFQLVFYAALVDYFARIRPSLTIYYQEVDYKLAGVPAELEQEYNRFLEASKLQQKPGEWRS
jgi:1-acyl-sn-glycerol-3-phosphate acyltransferase